MFKEINQHVQIRPNQYHRRQRPQFANRFQILAFGLENNKIPLGMEARGIL